MGKNREIGLHGKLLWHIPEEMRHFVNLTKGRVIVMGRRTFESIGKALPRRVNMVLTRDKDFAAPDCVLCSSVNEVLAHVQELGHSELMVIGGSQVYQLFLPLAEIIHLSEVDFEGSADCFFPSFDQLNFTCTEVQEHPSIDGRPAWNYRKFEKNNR